MHTQAMQLIKLAVEFIQQVALCEKKPWSPESNQGSRSIVERFSNALPDQSRTIVRPCLVITTSTQ